MPNENLELIRHSFPLIFQHKAEITTKFYEGLFRDAPELRRLFSKEMNVQKDMLVSVLTTLAKASFDEGLVESYVNFTGAGTDGGCGHECCLILSQVKKRLVKWLTKAG